MWSDPGQPPPHPNLAVALRAIMWAIIGVLVGGTTAIVWLFSDTEPPRLVTVMGNVSPQIGAALFGGGYLLWSKWHRPAGAYVARCCRELWLGLLGGLKAISRWGL